MNGLTKDQIERYRQDGYLVVPDLLTAPEVDTFSADAQLPKPEAWRGLGLRRYTVDPQWKFLATHPKISKMVQ